MRDHSTPTCNTSRHATEDSLEAQANFRTVEAALADTFGGLSSEKRTFEVDEAERYTGRHGGGSVALTINGARSESQPCTVTMSEREAATALLKTTWASRRASPNGQSTHCSIDSTDVDVARKYLERISGPDRAATLAERITSAVTTHSSRA